MGLSLVGAQLKPGELILQEASVYRIQGRRFQEEGDLRGAAASYRKAVIANPGYAEAHNDLGVVLESLGDNAGAEQAYQTAMNLKPQFPAAHSNLALLYERTGKLEEAAEHWRTRVKIGPPSDPWVVRAQEKLAQHRFSAAAVEEAPAAPMPKGGEISRPELVPRQSRGSLEMTASKQAAREMAKQRAREQALSAKERERAAREQISAAKEKARAAKELAEMERKGAKAAQQQERTVKLNAKEEKKQLKQAREAALKAEKEEARRKEELAGQQKTREAEKFKAIEAAQRKLEKQVPASGASNSLANQIAQEKGRDRGQTVRELIKRAVTAMRQGQYEEAVTHYQQVLMLDSGNREASQGLRRAQAAKAKARK